MKEYKIKEEDLVGLINALGIFEYNKINPIINFLKSRISEIKIEKEKEPIKKDKSKK